MRRLNHLVFILSLGMTSAFAQWPAWRGPDMNGIAPSANPPVTWNDSTHIVWKRPIPGKGLATPVISGDLLFVLTAVASGEKLSPEAIEAAQKETPDWMRNRAKVPEQTLQFRILALNRKKGQLVWEKTLREALPHEGTHETGSWASPSPVTDGQCVIASFGSFGLFCLNMQGDLLWETDLVDMNIRARFGEGSSPFLYKDRVITVWDHEGQSFIAVLDKSTGQVVWRKDRDEPTSWSTPIVAEVEGRPQIITSAHNWVKGYDLETGKELWKFTGLTLNVIPTPIYHQGVLYVASGFRGNAVMAVNIHGASGDLTGTDHILWQHDKNAPYTPSMLLDDGYLYFLKSNNGFLSCFNAEDGSPYYEAQRLPGITHVYASPISAAGRIYICGRKGNTLVIEKGPNFKVLASNALSDGIDASPVAVGSYLYIRGLTHLYCIAD